MKKADRPQMYHVVFTLISIGIMFTGCNYQSEDLSDILVDNEHSAVTTTNELTSDEISSLMFMVEEEKMAMDVYVQMFDLYGLKIFENISLSELSHVSAVSKLIDKYGLENPIIGNPPGVFENEELQQTYDALIEQGSILKLEAKKVGIIIEEKDIVDIQSYLDNVVISKDITQVYTNLLDGSKNHLEAFLGEL